MSTPTQYINSLEGDRKKEVRHLYDLIKKTIPKEKPFLYGKGTQAIIGFGKYQYRTKSGCEGDWFSVGLSSRKQYISLYICGVKDGKYIAELFKKKLPKAKIGKSCVTFKTLEDVDEKILIELTKLAVKHPMFT